MFTKLFKLDVKNDRFISRKLFISINITFVMKIRKINGLNCNASCRDIIFLFWPKLGK